MYFVHKGTLALALAAAVRVALCSRHVRAAASHLLLFLWTFCTQLLARLTH
jgi:hypothetical protein